MKNLKLVVVAAATVISTSALASKARKDALQNSFHLLDNTNVFTTVSDAMALPDFATLEMGAKDVGTTPNAEGGFLRSMGDAGKLGLFLGHGVAYRTTTTVLTNMNFAAYDNPLDIVYATKFGSLSFGIDFMYSATDRKSKTRKNIAGVVMAAEKDSSSAMTLRAGLGSDSWTAYTALGLGDTAELSNAAGTTAKYTNAPMTLGGIFTMDTLAFNAEIGMANSKITDNTTDTKNTKSTLTLGVINSHKQDANEFFYGISYVDVNEKTETTATSTTDTSKLLARMGVEFDAASWLVLRGSLTQPVLVSAVKKDLGTGAASTTDTLDNLTTVAAGAGIKLNKGMLDFTLSNMATTGLVQSNSLGAQASYTYNF